MAKKPGGLLGRLARGLARVVESVARELSAPTERRARPAPTAPPEPAPEPPPVVPTVIAPERPKRARKPRPTAAERRARLAAEAGPPAEEPPRREAEIRHNLAFRWSGDRLVLRDLGVAEDILEGVESVLILAEWNALAMSTMILHYQPSYIIDAEGKQISTERAAQKSIPKVNKTLESQLNALLYFAASDDVDEITGVDIVLGVATHSRRPRVEGEERAPRRKRAPRKRKNLGPVKKEDRETHLARERQRKKRARDKAREDKAKLDTIVETVRRKRKAKEPKP